MSLDLSLDLPGSLVLLYGENHVYRLRYREKREKEKDSIYIQESSGDCCAAFAILDFKATLGIRYSISSSVFRLWRL
jgi:hypothetical protein